MLQKACLILWLVLASLSASAQPPAPVTEVLEGLDPVLLAQGKEMQGELSLTVTRGRFKYFFANAENKALFEKDPARYEIQLEGHCARMGAPVRGLADLYAVHQSRIYIFGSEGCKTAFVAAPEKYLPPAYSPLTATPEALQKGQALIEKAVAALGGAAKLDSLTSYHEQSLSSATRGRNGETEVKISRELFIAFPDRVRLARTMPDYRDPAKTMNQAIVLLPGEEFGIGGPRGTFPVQKGIRETEESQLRQHPLHLLRLRRQQTFKAAALGAENGTERVAVEYNGERYVLSLDAATGRVLRVSCQRRGDFGDFGELVQTFSDFRTVDGLTLPFKVTATFNGQPWKAQSATIESITINGAIDPRLFEKPKPTQ